MKKQKLFSICMFFVMHTIAISELKIAVPFYKNKKIQFTGFVLLIGGIGLRYWWKKSFNNNDKKDTNVFKKPHQANGRKADESNIDSSIKANKKEINSALKNNEMKIDSSKVSDADQEQSKISFLEEIAGQTGVVIYKIKNKGNFNGMTWVTIDSSGYEYSFRKLKVCHAKNLIVKNNSFIKVPAEKLEKIIDSAFDKRNFFISNNDQEINVNFYTYLQHWFRSREQKEKNINIESVFFFQDLNDITKIVCAYALREGPSLKHLSVEEIDHNYCVFTKGIEQKRER